MFHELEQAKTAVEGMKYGLRFYKDEDKKKKQIALINTLIKLINCTESMVNQSPDKNLMEVVLLSNIKAKYEELAGYTQKGFSIDVGELDLFRQQLGLDLELGSVNKLNELALQIALDNVSCIDGLTDQEQSENLVKTKNKKLLGYISSSKDHWVLELRKFLEYSIKKAMNGVSRD